MNRFFEGIVLVIYASWKGISRRLNYSKYGSIYLPLIPGSEIFLL